MITRSKALIAEDFPASPVLDISAPPPTYIAHALPVTPDPDKSDNVAGSSTAVIVRPRPSIPRLSPSYQLDLDGAELRELEKLVYGQAQNRSFYNEHKTAPARGAFHPALTAQGPLRAMQALMDKRIEVLTKEKNAEIRELEMTIDILQHTLADERRGRQAGNSHNFYIGPRVHDSHAQKGTQPEEPDLETLRSLYKSSMQDKVILRHTIEELQRQIQAFKTVGLRVAIPRR